MHKEWAAGIIPLQKKGDAWFVLLVQHTKGNYWGFPKGHLEEGEEPLECARRELFEETGLRVKRLLDEEILTESYTFSRGEKEVVYFCAEVVGTPRAQEGEVEALEFVPLSEAPSRITFPESQKLARDVLKKEF